jgi:hypothetical protein
VCYVATGTCAYDDLNMHDRKLQTDNP